MKKKAAAKKVTQKASAPTIKKTKVSKIGALAAEPVLVNHKSEKQTNAFLSNIFKKDTFTENGAISNSTTGVSIIDQFGKSGSHRNRDLQEVYSDQSKIWAEDKLTALRFVFYLRMITRQTKGIIVTEKVQKGQGNKDESFKRLLWFAQYHPDLFYNNLWMLPIVGSWKDLFALIVMDRQLKTKVINRGMIYDIIQAGLQDEAYNKALIQKFLPAAKSLKKCKTERAKTLNKVAKELITHFGWTYKEYRKLKSTGKAHEFQRAMCAGLYDNLNFNQIPGKALFNMSKGKFLKKHNLEAKYLAWLETKPVAKFTGYVYEMYDSVLLKNPSLVQKTTIDKQFLGLLDLAKRDGAGLSENVWVAIDTSGSMKQRVANTKAISLSVSLGIYFASLNEGAFHNQVIMFDERSKVFQLKGESFCDKVTQISHHATSWGSTNFQSLIDEIVRVRETHPEIPVTDYPKTLLVVSDMQFNATGTKETNYEMAMRKLVAVGLPKIKIIWWNCVGRGGEFPSTFEDEGTYFISGFDGAIVTMLCNGKKVVDEKTGKAREQNMEDKIHDALNQEALLQVNL